MGSVHGQDETVQRQDSTTKKVEVEEPVEEEEVVVVVAVVDVSVANRHGRSEELPVRGLVANQVQPSRVGVHEEWSTRPTGRRKVPSSWSTVSTWRKWMPTASSISSVSMATSSKYEIRRMPSLIGFSYLSGWHWWHFGHRSNSSRRKKALPWSRWATPLRLTELYSTWTASNSLTRKWTSSMEPILVDFKLCGHVKNYGCWPRVGIYSCFILFIYFLIFTRLKPLSFKACVCVSFYACSFYFKIQ